MLKYACLVCKPLATVRTERDLLHSVKPPLCFRHDAETQEARHVSYYNTLVLLTYHFGLDNMHKTQSYFFIHRDDHQYPWFCEYNFWTCALYSSESTDCYSTFQVAPKSPVLGSILLYSSSSPLNMMHSSTTPETVIQKREEEDQGIECPANSQASMAYDIMSSFFAFWTPVLYYVARSACTVNDPVPRKSSGGTFSFSNGSQQLQGPIHPKIPCRPSCSPWCATASIQSFTGGEGQVEGNSCRVACWTSTYDCET